LSRNIGRKERADREILAVNQKRIAYLREIKYGRANWSAGRSEYVY